MAPWKRVLGLSCLLLLSACGTGAPDAVPAGTPSAGRTSSDPTSPDPTDRDPTELLWGRATLLQPRDGEPQLCLGGVAESYPPQCGGPTVVGLDWEEVDGVERAAGVTWATAYVVGTFDGSAFTLTSSPSTSPPDGVDEPSPAPAEFPQLCDDPFRGGDPSATGDQEALGQALERLDGYVTSWVSDGSSMFNVVVTGDAEAAHADLRRVWSGGLCVVQRDLPTQAAVSAAQEALGAGAEQLGLLSSGAGTDGLLHVSVQVADATAVAAVRERVEPWLRPDQVVVTGALQPVPG